MIFFHKFDKLLRIFIIMFTEGPWGTLYSWRRKDYEEGESF